MSITETERAATAASASMPAPAPAKKKATQSKSRLRFNQAMKLVRRSHLYAGLFMTPWVFLYGVTALLFNHPFAFPDQESYDIKPADFAGTPLQGFLNPQSLATGVVDAINKANDKGSGTPPYKLVQPEAAAFTREYFTTVAGESEDYSVRLNLTNGEGLVRTSPKRQPVEREAPAPFATAPIPLESKPMESVSKSITLVLNRMGFSPTEPPASSSAMMPSQAEGKTEGRSERKGEQRRRGEESADGGPADGSRADGPRNEGAAKGGEGQGRRGGRRAEQGGSGGPAATPGEPAAEGGERKSSRGAAEGERKNAMAQGGPATGGPGGGGRSGRGVAGPELNFLMEGEGKIWKVAYDLQTGAITGRPEDAAARAGEPLSFRRYLLRLHMAHGYPADLNARWIWAVAVDVMFVCMVGWGITGLLMWWQMKNVRKIGAVLLVLSVVVSLASAIGMHSAMINP